MWGRKKDAKTGKALQAPQPQRFGQQAELTPQLRYVIAKNGSARLQQAMQLPNGTLTWHDIPMVTESKA